MSTPNDQPDDNHLPRKPKPKRPRKPKPKRIGKEAFDIAFDVFPRKPGSKGPIRSHSKSHISRIFSEALLLRASSVMMVFNMIRANDKVICHVHRNDPIPGQDPDDFGDPDFPDPGNANRALVILGIASIKKRSEEDGPPQLLIEQWAVDEGLKRYGRRSIHSKDRAAIERHMRNRDGENPEAWDSWPSLPEPEPYKVERPYKRSFDEQKFKPGESGNPYGRRPAPKYDLPFPFLNARGVLHIDGQPYSMTRAQAFIHRMSTATFPSDSSIPRALGKLMIDLTLERWKRPGKELPKYGYRTPGQLNFSECLEFLFLAKKLNPKRACRRMMIEPWIVQQALHWLAVDEEPPLTLVEQKIVVEATRTPWKVQWPEYWEVEIPKRRASPTRKVGPSPAFRG